MSEEGWRLIMGFRHVQGIPLCPCRDPGNYVRAEQSLTNPLLIRFTCWCGRTVNATCEDLSEVDELVTSGRIK